MVRSTLDFKQIGKKIKERRKLKGITQEQMAEYLDVNPSHISNIECGRSHPSLNAFVQIANCLECSMDNFISDEYTFTGNKAVLNEDSLYMQISEKLSDCGPEKWEKLMKIIDIM